MRKLFPLLAALSIALLITSAASAQSAPPQSHQKQGSAADGLDPDEQAIHNYILTMDKVQKYADTSKKIRETTEKDPTLATEMKKITDADVNDRQRAALVAASPHLYALLKASGMTARDFVLIPVTIMTAGFALSMEEQGAQLPPFVNPTNVKFVRDHKKDIQQAGFMQKDEDSADPNSQ